MSQFLYTFSSKQFSQEFEPSKENDSRAVSPRRNQTNIKHIRTKKLKRYEKWLEPKGIRKHLTEPENQFIGLENITSQTLVRLSQNSAVIPPRSIKTIQENTRKTAVRQIKLSDCLRQPLKSQTIYRGPHRISSQIDNEQQLNQNKKSIYRKRCYSLKDTPLIHYPSDQRKLPRAFRCKSIYQEPSSAQRNRVVQQAKLYLNNRTPKIIKPSLAKINVQMIKVIKSSRELEGKEKQEEQMNEELHPVTPAFGAF